MLMDKINVAEFFSRKISLFGKIKRGRSPSFELFQLDMYGIERFGIARLTLTLDWMIQPLVLMTRSRSKAGSFSLRWHMRSWRLGGQNTSSRKTTSKTIVAARFHYDVIPTSHFSPPPRTSVLQLSWNSLFQFASLFVDVCEGFLACLLWFYMYAQFLPSQESLDLSCCISIKYPDAWNKTISSNKTLWARYRIVVAVLPIHFQTTHSSCTHVNDQRRNPIDFGSWDQRSRSTLALCV